MTYPVWTNLYLGCSLRNVHDYGTIFVTAIELRVQGDNQRSVERCDAVPKQNAYCITHVSSLGSRRGAAPLFVALSWFVIDSAPTDGLSGRSAHSVVAYDS